MALNDRTISIKTKKLIKSNKVRIMKSRGAYYLEAIPSEYVNNLTADQLNQMYRSFIELGRKLYNDNKDKNISNIIIEDNGFLNLDIHNTLLRNDVHNFMTDSKIRDVRHQLDEILGINRSFNISGNNYILLKNNNLKTSNEKLKAWLLDNFIPVIEQSDVKDEETNKYWSYVDDGTLIDMAIFCYLVTYAIINIKYISNGKTISKKDPITFSDFITGKSDPNDKLYINIVNQIIYLYELSHIYNLYGYNKLSYDYESGIYKMTRQYENIMGVLWHIFKLYLAENYNIIDINDKRIPISICEDCGNPVLGNVLRCSDCEISNVNIRQEKCRKEKLEHIDRIEKLVDKYKKKLPKDLVLKANNYISMNKSQKIHSKKHDVDILLDELESYINKKK